MCHAVELSLNFYINIFLSSAGDKMSSITSVFNIGVESLAAYQSALSVSGQNIANANTPNYSRREVNFVERLFSEGVGVSDISRIVDEQANLYAQQSNSNFSSLDTYLQSLQNFEPFFDDASTNIGTYITSSLGALRQLNADAGSVNNRTVYLGKLQNLVTQIQTGTNEINRQQNNVNQSLTNVTQEVNSLLTRIGNINKQIMDLNGTGIDDSALLDQRDGLLHNLSDYLDFTTQVESNDTLSISLTNGLRLLSGNQPAVLETIADSANPSALVLAIKENNNVIPIDASIHSGKIAGYLNFRQTMLDPTQRTLDRLALSLSEEFNKQNALGVDASGNLGGNIFTDINSTTAIQNRVTANTNNTGSGVMTVNITDSRAITTSDYKLTIGNAQSYTLTRISDGAVMSSGTISGSFPQTISADGFSLSVNSGTFSQGDQYIVSPTKQAASNMNLAFSDTSKLALGWPVNTTANSQNTGSGKISVSNILSTTGSAFSVANQLNPPITINVVSNAGVLSYNIVNSNTNAVIEGPIAYNSSTGADIFPTPGNYDPGYRVNLSGTLSVGDSFNITYNSNPGSDNRNGLKMETLYESGSLLGGDGQMMSFNQGYNALNSAIAIKTNEAKGEYTNLSALKKNADAQREAISGVSLQEETMNLAQFQQAYQASAQIIQTAHTIFQTLIQMIR